MAGLRSRHLRRHLHALHEAEAGSALVMVGVGFAAAVMALVLVINVGAYFLAASRAQDAADAAALAAAQVADPHGRTPGSPRAAAAQVAAAAGGRLLDCDCRRGQTEVTVSVRMSVGGLLITRYAPREVAATARAHLVPASRADPGRPPTSADTRVAPSRR